MSGGSRSTTPTRVPSTRARRRRRGVDGLPSSRALLSSARVFHPARPLPCGIRLVYGTRFGCELAVDDGVVVPGLAAARRSRLRLADVSPARTCVSSTSTGSLMPAESPALRRAIRRAGRRGVQHDEPLVEFATIRSPCQLPPYMRACGGHSRSRGPARACPRWRRRPCESPRASGCRRRREPSCRQARRRSRTRRVRADALRPVPHRVEICAFRVWEHRGARVGRCRPTRRAGSAPACSSRRAASRCASPRRRSGRGSRRSDGRSGSRRRGMRSRRSSRRPVVDARRRVGLFRSEDRTGGSRDADRLTGLEPRARASGSIRASCRHDE